MITLIVIGAIYVVLGIWCTVTPRAAAKAVGFELPGPGGMSEFITVYGGIEVGLGLAMILTALDPQLRRGGLAFALVFSAMLPLFRLPTVIVLPVPRSCYWLLAVEITLAVALLIAWFRR